MNQDYSGGYAANSHDVRAAGVVRRPDAGILTPLEKMPHVFEKIQKLWGKKDFNFFIKSLLMDSRDGSRQGFPVEAVEDLVMLAEINTIGRALVLARRMNAPYRDALRKIEAELESDPGNPFADPMSSRETARYGPENKGPKIERPPRNKANAEQSPGMIGSLMGLMLNRYTLALIIVLMVLRAIWPGLFK